MALQKLTRELRFGGLDTKTARELVPEGKLLALTDSEFLRPDALNKRTGYTALSTTAVLPGGNAAITAGVALSKLGNSLLLADGSRLYRQASGKWQALGSGAPGSFLPGAVLEPSTPMLQLPPQSTTGVLPQTLSCDFAVLNGVGLVVATLLYSTDPQLTVAWSIVDMTTSAILASGSSYMSGGGGARFAARAVATATRLLAIYPNPTSIASIRVQAWDPANISAAAPAPVNIVTDWDLRAPFEVCYNATLGALLAYSAAPGGVGVIKFQKFTEAGPTGGSGSVSATGVITSGLVLVPCASGRFGIAWSGSVYLLNSDYTVVRAAPGSVGNFAVGIGYEYAADSVRIYSAISATAPSTLSMTITPLANGNDPMSLYNVVPASKPFTYRGLPVAWFRYAYTPDGVADTQPLYLLMRLDLTADTTSRAPRMLGTALDGNAQPTSVAYPNLKSVMPGSVSSTSALLPGMKLGANTAVVPALVQLDVSAPVRSAVIDGIATLTGLQAYETDGTLLQEAGFHLAPEITSTLIGGAGSGSIPAGTYSLIAVNASYDSNGNVTYSPPSAPKTGLVIAANGSLNATVVHYHNSQRTGVVLIYMSADGVTYYLAGSFAGDDTAATVGGALTWNTAAAQLYTTGNVLETASPPCLVDVIARGRRLYGVTPQGVLFYTLEKVVGQSPPWAPLATKLLAQDPGQHFQLADLDGRLLAFGENVIQWMSGEGVSNTGTSDNLSTPQIIPDDTGGIVRYSPLLVAGDGVWMKQRKGIVVLTRSLAFEFEGLPVDSSSGLTTVSAVAVSHRNQLRFGASNGACLVYDTVKRQWSTFSNHNQVDAEYLGGTYYMLLSNGTVWQANEAAWTDAGAAIGRTVETPWIKLNGLAGVQRLFWLHLLAEWFSSTTLQVAIYYDHNDATPAETITLTQATAPTGLDWWRHHCGRRCSAFKLVITETSAGQGVSLLGLSLELGVRGGKLAPLGSSQSA